MKLQDKLSPSKKQSDRAIGTAYTPSNQNFKHQNENQFNKADQDGLSDRERIQLQKYRLLNYSPPGVKTATTATTMGCAPQAGEKFSSQQKMAVNASMERRRTSAAVMNINRSELQQ